MVQISKRFRGLVVISALLLAAAAAYLIGRNLNQAAGPGQAIPSATSTRGAANEG